MSLNIALCSKVDWAATAACVQAAGALLALGVAIWLSNRDATNRKRDTQLRLLTSLRAVHEAGVHAKQQIDDTLSRKYIQAIGFENFLSYMLRRFQVIAETLAASDLQATATVHMRELIAIRVALEDVIQFLPHISWQPESYFTEEANRLRDAGYRIEEALRPVIASIASLSKSIDEK